MPLDDSYPHLICSRLVANVVTDNLGVREAACNLPDFNLDDSQPLAEGGEDDD